MKLSTETSSMTRIAGYSLNMTTCCGAIYKTPRYRSMNFSAWEYWTDGYRHDSLMPGGHGLRKCKCGNFFMLAELQEITEVEESDAPSTQQVTPEELPFVIAQARTPAIEQAARLEYWEHLNHPYRERYRAHRDAEEAATKAAWEAADPDTRTWWQRFRKVLPPQYKRPKDSPFTYPLFDPTHEQRENMLALLKLLQEQKHPDHEALAELHRELGQYEEAERELQLLTEDDQSTATRVITQMIKERMPQPMRFRM
jgi:hypothetical protein